ncbi:MAG: flagellar filament capping protein FliD [Dehalococcoidia bacterium]|nr:flagellar filament capping protein FliD [Dehalococcoidia bacterium]
MVTDRLSFGGLASGLDTNAIIDALVQVRMRPILLAESRKAGVQVRKDALRQVGGSLGSLLGQIKALTTASTFSGRATNVQGGPEPQAMVAASASSSAAVGSFTLDIVSLASATRAASTTALGLAVDAGVPLDEAGFATARTAGTFTVNGTEFTIPAATNATVASAAAIGAAVDQTVALDTAGLDIAPVSGTFEVNGVSIAFDATSDSLNDIVSRINGAEAGVTATYDTDTGVLTLEAEDEGVAAITLADTAGNFLQSMKLIDGGGAVIGTETAGTALMSLTDVVAMINGASIGVTASLVDDAYGRPNLLQVDGGGSAVTLGAGADTSNFLQTTHLLASPGGTTRTSLYGLGGVSLAADLQDARLQTALSQPAGSFEINGVEFTFDAENDSLSNVISRINQSSAGVTAAYDLATDRLTLTSKATGSTSISLEDVDGNFLVAVGLSGAAQTLGENASYRVDGGALRYSTSNTVADAVPGVTLTLKETTPAAVTVDVSQDNGNAKTAIQALVKQFNAARTLMKDLTKYVEDGQSGVLMGDSTVRIVDRRLRSAIVAPALGVDGPFQSLQDIGLSFGAIGSAVGATDELSFNVSKFDQAMAEDPEAVRRLFAGFEAAAGLEPAGTGSIESVSGTPTAATRAGTYTIESSILGDLTVTFRPADGGTAVVSTGTITAGGVNTSLIPGVTIQAKAALVAGTDEITLTATQQGVMQSLQSYVDGLTRVGGLMEARDTELQTRIRDINDQIDAMEDRIGRYQEGLIRKFTALEVTIARLQGQQQALAGLSQQLAANRLPQPR